MDGTPFHASQPLYYSTSTGQLCKESPAAAVQLAKTIIEHTLKKPFSTRQAIQTDHHYIVWTCDISTVVFPRRLAALWKMKE